MAHNFDLKQFAVHLKKKHTLLRSWASENDISCYRVYHHDIADIPLYIDIYGKHLHVVLIERQEETFSNDELEGLLDTIARSLYFPRERVFFKFRELLKDKQQYSRFSSEGVWIDATEGGLGFRINLSDYLDTGLFLDHRLTRGIVREISRGLRVLNLFAYTGAFSVYAASGGARKTTTVDMSNVYLQWARENMAKNGFLSPDHEYVNDDVLRFLNQAADEKRIWDLILLDPPTFSNSRKMEKVLDIQRDHVMLLDKCLGLMAKNGVLLFSTNFKKFKMNSMFEEKASAEEITRKTIPEDFRGTKIHRCWILRK